ncbi:MAG: ribosomal protein bacterial/organelle type [Clostridiales bacterium]|jgi:small subunit ribosomal protein S4|nr:ribosomal protein bacterial/organelle type [Clostridiales bacterium]
MARYTDSDCRLCRREGEKLFLKGERCYTNKCAVARRAYAPGQHGQAKKKLSEYGVQLREKQKARRFYGILEGQFRKYFDMAVKRKGITGENLLQILETRLDNVVFRLGLATSRPEARQLVKHGHFTINGKRLDIPSYLVKVGDVVAVSEKFKNSPKIKTVVDIAGGKVVSKWLDFNPDTLTGTVSALPTREDIDLPIREHLIVELYSK